ncbi:protein of unknown function [Azospirillum baldaniorum]|uniref:FAD-binding PCMH-type domain-containing protein n=1 Tax=Azospirillum baldaniorum TaxID=1064539 RepID=A0A9P1NLM1_9PROT|nr:protein of unknown function [Azospirillum baldaniorum]
MGDFTLRTADRRDATLSEDAVNDLAARLRGPLLTPQSPGYDEARTIWNAMIDRRPGLIARCAGAADVMQAVRFARENGLLVSVRGGGHNIAGNSLCDGGLLIDLGALRFVHVDPISRTARVAPGATLGDLDRETQAFGLAVPVGINSTTGIAGLTLGGGFGWLTRKYGLTVDNLLSADVVTADGKFLRASADENADLFWAIRGGGGQLRRRHLLHLPPASRGADGVRRAGRPSLRRGRRPDAPLPRRHGGPAGRGHRLDGAAQGAAPALPAAGRAWQGGGGHARHLRRRRRGGGPQGAGTGAVAGHARRRAYRPHALRGVAGGLRPASGAGRAELLEIAELHRAGGRADRPAGRGGREAALRPVRDLRRSAWRGSQPRAGGRHRLPAPRRPLRHERARALEHFAGGQRLHPMGARRLRPDRPLRHGRGLCELRHRRRTARPGRLRAELRTPAGAEGEIRPRQPLLREPEHRAGRVTAPLRSGFVQPGTRLSAPPHPPIRHAEHG